MCKTILVTGACGFTGSNMLEYLDGYCPDANIVATDIPDSTRREFYTEKDNNKSPQPVYYRDIINNVDAKFIPADFTELQSVKKLVANEKYDLVFNIASLFDYFATREKLFSVNVTGTKNFFRELASKQPGTRVIHWSTLGVLGDAGFCSPKDEDSSYHPHNRYCESKVEQERVVKSYTDSLDTTILRPAPIYGPRHQYGVYHILKLLRQMNVAPVTKIYPRSMQLQFPSVHVSDLVRAAHHLSGLDGAIGETYNILSNCIGQDELIEFLSSELSLKKVIIPMPYIMYSMMSKMAYPISIQMEKMARKYDTRPPVDAPMVRYLTANMWFSNEKLKKSGFDLEYEDPRDGLQEYISWCEERSYL